MDIGDLATWAGIPVQIAIAGFGFWANLHFWKKNAADAAERDRLADQRAREREIIADENQRRRQAEADARAEAAAERRKALQAVERVNEALDVILRLGDDALREVRGLVDYFRAQSKASHTQKQAYRKPASISHLESLLPSFIGRSQDADVSVALRNLHQVLQNWFSPSTYTAPELNSALARDAAQLEQALEGLRRCRRSPPS